MKRTLLLLPALALALAACTPASPESAAAPTAALEETAAPATTETAAFPVGQLVDGTALRQTGDAYYTTDYDMMQDDSLLPCVLKLDYATATMEKIWQADQGVEQYVDPLVRGGQIYLIAGEGTLYRIPLDGGEATVTTLERQFYFSAADEYGAYSFAYDARVSGLSGSRMDLQTCQITDLTMPVQTEGIYAVGEDHFLLTRLLTEVPLPGPDEPDLYEAVIQNATREYDWYDPATGALEKIFEEPYYEPEQSDGSRKGRLMLGMAAERLYFQWDQGTEQRIVASGIESCDMSGEDWLPLAVSQEGNSTNYGAGLFRDGKLCWIIHFDGNGDYQLYDLTTGENHENINLKELPGVVSSWPETFADDGRVLLRIRDQTDQTSSGLGWALISAEEYLDGSTDWTPVTMSPDTAS